MFKFKPDYVVHLAGISFAAELDFEAIYKVNIAGTVNLLDALKQVKSGLKKVILASSATVYGDVLESRLAEQLYPKPVNHYGLSKFTMEHAARIYYDEFPIIITRPFNYTGIGHDNRFLIPKIIHTYKNNSPSITLGNLNISREFNDVRDVVSVYRLLLLSEFKSGIVNICSGKSIKLLKIINIMNEISGNTLKVYTSEKYSRSNEIKDLSGDCVKLNDLINYTFKYNIEDTLKHMYEN